MADKQRKGLVARWLEGKERDEEYARSTLPTNRWALFWDILKGRMGRLILTNFLMLITFLPLIAVIVWRVVQVYVQGVIGPYGAGLLVGYPVIVGQSVLGMAESVALQLDLIAFALFIPAGIIAGLGISGGAYIIRNLIWTEGVFVANDFARGIKRNFWNVTEAVVLFTVFLFVARTMANLADYFVAVGDPLSGWMIASKVVGYVLVAFAALVCMWMIALGINYKQGPWALLRNAVVMTVGTFPQTVFFAVIAAAPVLLIIFGGNSLIMIIGVSLVALVGISYFFLVWMDFTQWAFDKYVNPNLGFAVGRGLYNKDKSKEQGKAKETEDSEAMREYRRMIVAAGKSALVSRPIKPIDDGVELYELPESFSREDLKKLRESKQFMEEDVKAYEEEHKNDAQYVEYNQQFEEREKALKAEEKKGKKKKAPKPPKMLNKRK